MLTLERIASFYPEYLAGYPRFLLREYLQHKIIEIIYDTQYGQSLSFMGGTCLRIVHENKRFSEDLDFDNRGMNEREFNNLTKQIKMKLELEGYTVEIKEVIRGAWHCYIRFPGLLFKEGLSGYREEKILIQIDTEPQHIDYEPERIIVNKFDIFATVLTTPLSLLLSQKIYEILNRKRKKGRDFYDVVFLYGRGVVPDFQFLQAKTGIADSEKLKSAILEIVQDIDMRRMSKDVEPFLFRPEEKKKVLLFKDFCRQKM